MIELIIKIIFGIMFLISAIFSWKCYINKVTIGINTPIFNISMSMSFLLLSIIFSIIDQFIFSDLFYSFEYSLIIGFVFLYRFFYITNLNYKRWYEKNPYKKIKQVLFNKKLSKINIFYSFIPFIFLNPVFSYFINLEKHDTKYNFIYAIFFILIFRKIKNIKFYKTIKILTIIIFIISIVNIFIECFMPNYYIYSYCLFIILAFGTSIHLLGLIYKLFIKDLDPIK